MRLTFPLYLVIDPTPVSELADVLVQLDSFSHLERCAIGGAHLESLFGERGAVLYTDEAEAAADAAARLAARTEKPAAPDLLALADEAIDAIDDAKTRSTFSSWEAAGAKVAAYREARAKR